MSRDLMHGKGQRHASRSLLQDACTAKRIQYQKQIQYQMTNVDAFIVGRGHALAFLETKAAESKAYVCRVGRTARGRHGKGKALLFLLPEELGFLRFLKVGASQLLPVVTSAE